ncbi:UbiA family prenyltransferase [Dissulfurirhabdus thermomarina]|uniref:4-hydroxybenzoate polyprenyltransferase n=2 Tax=Dissulfurirhabdus thermomarina TaxID=1765737 RepID=A0A6N9TN39_DISTH|nr:UbiA-like polyprenyltransferase [Dissulfurirhabdus thermomarina]NDY42468.1 UbiA family prenyltransferase [Dissulfurirhabdus thermomarina]
MIKFEHTLFALPFAYLGAFLAAGGPPDAATAAWILAAMVGARTCAMAFNRLVDLPFDARNPRTRDRALPRGEVRPAETWGLIAASAALFFVAAWRLNPLALALSPPVLAVILLYSYTKRFTALCHLFLGLALGIAPAAGWIAVRGAVSLTPLVLAAGVLFWVAGFDILYACLDVAFDRAAGLHSIPARLGVPAAFRLARAFHVVALAAFIAVGRLAGLGWIYAAGLAVTAALMILQHSVVRPDDLSRMDMAFFTANGAISLVLFAATALDLALGG